MFNMMKFSNYSIFVIITLLSLLFCLNSFSQSYDYLDFNQIKARVNSNGALFHDEIVNDKPSFEVPQGLGRHTIFIANLWIAGIDENGDLHAVGPKFNQTPENYFGPIANDYNAEDYRLKYNNVWKVGVEQIQEHIYNFTKPDYVMPESFQNWPAEGNVENGEAAELAPYYDYNQNGKYDPENGDFPLIKGDHAVYFIYNESQGHNSTGGEIMGLEFHGMLYGFNSTVGSVLTETVFLNYQIINRSQHNYTDVYAGLWTEFDIGYAKDDQFGSDTLNQMMYVYNATNIDGNGQDSIEGMATYGSPPPVQGVVLLNPDFYASVIPTYIGAHPGIGYEFDDEVVLNLLKGRSMNGVPFYDPYEWENGDTIVTTFYQSGYPELGTGWIPEISWSGGYPSDVRGLISAGPYSLNKGKKLCLDFALPYARDYQGTNLTALTLLREKASLILDYFEEYDLGCDSYQSGIVQKVFGEKNFEIYPNPAFEIINVDLSKFDDAEIIIKIYTLDGKLINEVTTSEEHLELETPTKGIYLLNIETSKISISKKFTVI